MPRYSRNTNGQLVKDGARYPSGFRLVLNTGGSYFLNCCGLVGIEGFNTAPMLTDWQDKAELMACIYRELFTRGTAVYALTNEQLQQTIHLALLECGAVEMGVFPNMYHGPRMVHMFRINVRNICGRFCNKYGEAYAEPPKDDSEIIPEQTGPSPWGYSPTDIFPYVNGYAQFPQRH